MNVFPLISIETESDNNKKSDKIYTNFNENEFKDFASPQQAEWGIYSKKPISQISWEESVSKTIAAVADQCAQDNFPPEEGDLRPKMFDKGSNRWLLVDTGASLSIWPKAHFDSSRLWPKADINSSPF